VEIFNDSLQLPGVTLGNLAAKDYGEFVGLADGSVGV
jgi:hypothetical protein